MKAFYWLAITGKVSTTENPRIRGLLLDYISNLCVLCGKKGEIIDDLFVNCEFGYFIWCSFLCRSGVSWCYLGLSSKLSRFVVKII